MSSNKHSGLESAEPLPHEDGYERRDVSLKSIIFIGLAIVAAIVVTVVFLSDFFIASKEKIVYEQQLKPESLQLRELRAQEAEILNSYAVIDSVKGIYRIPIGRAMAIQAEEAFKAEVKQRETGKQ